MSCGLLLVSALTRLGGTVADREATFRAEIGVWLTVAPCNNKLTPTGNHRDSTMEQLRITVAQLRSSAATGKRQLRIDMPDLRAGQRSEGEKEDAA